MIIWISWIGCTLGLRMARNILVLLIFITATIQYSDGANLSENMDITANSRSFAVLPPEMTPKTTDHKRIILPTMEEIILDEEFIVVPKEKNKTTKLSTQKPEKISNFTTKLTASNTINKKNKPHLEENYNEYIEPLDSTNTEPTSTSRQPVTTKPQTTLTTKTSLATTTKVLSTTASSAQCTQSDDVTATGCDFSNFETCGPDNTCECFPGYDRIDSTGECEAYNSFTVSLKFESTPITGYMANEKFMNEAACPEDITTYIDEVVAESDYAKYFFPGRDLDEHCDIEPTYIEVNVTLAFEATAVPPEDEDNVAAIFTAPDVPPLVLNGTSYNTTTSSSSYSVPSCPTNCDQNANCSESKGVCSCYDSYIDLTPKPATGIKCGTCSAPCANSGTCVGDYQAYVAVCQCSSWFYYGNTCDDSYAVVIGVGIGAGVLVIAAAVTGGIFWNRKKKQKKLAAEAADRQLEEELRRHTNFSASPNSDYLEYLGQDTEQ